MKDLLLKYNLIFISAFLIIFSSCSRKYKIPDGIAIRDYYVDGKIKELNDGGFEGIRSSIDQLETGKKLNIMLVHGMTTKTIYEFNGMVDNLGKFLNLTYRDSFIYNLHKTYGDGYQMDESPQVKITRFTDKKDGEKEIRFIYVHWSPATKKYKDRMIITEDSIDSNLRASLNEKLKRSVVDDGFGDVASLFDKQIQKKIFSAFEAALLLSYVPLGRTEVNLDEIEFTDEPNILISGSLGSKLTLEFLANYKTYQGGSGELLNKFNNNNELLLVSKMPSFHQDLVLKASSSPEDFTSKLASNLGSKTHKWYLLSNQLPLLDGVRFDFKELYDVDILGFLSLQTERITLASSIDLISFYDPNDLLGFRILGRNFYDQPYARKLYNIEIPVQCKKLKLLKLELANPAIAHSGSKHHPYVLYMISNGWNGDTSSLPKKKSDELFNIPINCQLFKGDF